MRDNPSKGRKDEFSPKRNDRKNTFRLVFTNLLWLSLYNNLIHVILLANFNKVHDLAIDDGLGVKLDNITNFVDLYSGAGCDA